MQLNPIAEDSYRDQLSPVGDLFRDCEQDSRVSIYLALRAEEEKSHPLSFPPSSLSAQGVREGMPSQGHFPLTTLGLSQVPCREGSCQALGSPWGMECPGPCSQSRWRPLASELAHTVAFKCRLFQHHVVTHTLRPDPVQEEQNMGTSSWSWPPSAGPSVGLDLCGHSEQENTWDGIWFCEKTSQDVLSVERGLEEEMWVLRGDGVQCGLREDCGSSDL